MLADADEQAPATTTLASSDRAIAIELEMETEYLRTRAGRPEVPRGGKAGGETASPRPASSRPDALDSSA
jgi:hypothetical protein